MTARSKEQQDSQMTHITLVPVHIELWASLPSHRTVKLLTETGPLETDMKNGAAKPRNERWQSIKHERTHDSIMFNLHYNLNTR